MRGTGMARWMLTSGMWRTLSKSLLFAAGMSNWSPAPFSTPSFLRGRPTMIRRKTGGRFAGRGGGVVLVLSCGSNDAGQLGLGHRCPHVSNRSPQVVEAMKGEPVLSVHTGWEYSLALLDGGTVVGWGAYGQLDIGGRGATRAPVHATPPLPPWPASVKHRIACLMIPRVSMSQQRQEVMLCRCWQLLGHPDAHVIENYNTPKSKVGGGGRAGGFIRIQPVTLL